MHDSSHEISRTTCATTISSVVSITSGSIRRKLTGGDEVLLVLVTVAEGALPVAIDDEVDVEVEGTGVWVVSDDDVAGGDVAVSGTAEVELELDVDVDDAEVVDVVVEEVVDLVVEEVVEVEDDEDEAGDTLDDVVSAKSQPLAGAGILSFSCPECPCLVASSSTSMSTNLLLPAE